jgi:hypothetical protein
MSLFHLLPPLPQITGFFPEIGPLLTEEQEKQFAEVWTVAGFSYPDLPESPIRQTVDFGYQMQTQQQPTEPYPAQLEEEHPFNEDKIVFAIKEIDAAYTLLEFSQVVVVFKKTTAQQSQ